MDCVHGLVSDTCKYELGGEDLWGVMVIDRPLDYTQVELDERLWVELTLDGASYSVTVAEAGQPTDNPCPSEKDYWDSWFDMVERTSDECQLCIEARYDGVEWLDSLEQHIDLHLPVDVDRALPTQILPTVGRPVGMRVGFTKHSAGEQGVETLIPEDLQPQELDVTPLEWDEPVETIVTPHEDTVRLRWELSESRQYRQEVLEARRDEGYAQQAEWSAYMWGLKQELANE